MALSAGTAYLDVEPQLSGGFNRTLEGAIGSKLPGLGGIAGKAGLAIGGGIVTGVGAAIAGGVISTKAFADLETGLNEVATLLPDIDDTGIAELRDEVQAFSREAGVLPSDVLPALYQALSAGVPADNVFDFLDTANRAALGGVTDLETSVDALTSVTNAYGSDVLDTATASDQLFTAVRLGKTNFEELGASLFNVVPTAAGLGVEFGDITSALAALTSQGTPTSVATTQLRQALVELSKEGSNVATVFEEASGQSFRDFIAGGGDLEGALAIVNEAAGDAGVNLTDLFGSVEAGNAVLGLTSENGARLFSNALAETAEAAGSTDAAFERMDQGLSRTWDKVKAAAASALTDVGERIAPFVQRAGDLLAEVLPGAIDFLIGTVERLAPIFEAVFGVLSGIFEAFRGTSTGASSDAGEAFGTFGTIVGQIGELITTILGGLAAFWDEWGGTITAVVTTVFGTVVDVIGGALDIISGIFDVVLGILTGDWSRAWDGIKGIVSGAWDAITGLVSGAFQLILDLAAGFVSNLFGGVSGGIGNVVDIFRELPGRILGVLASLPGAMLQLGADLISGLISGLGNVASLVGNKIRSGVSSAVSNVKSFFGIGSPSKVIAAELGLPIAQGVALGAEATGDLAGRALVGGIDSAAATARKAAAGAFAGIAQADALDVTASTALVDGTTPGSAAAGTVIDVAEGAIVVNNPTPEPASVSVPAELRRLATTLTRS